MAGCGLWAVAVAVVGCGMGGIKIVWFGFFSGIICFYFLQNIHISGILVGIFVSAH
jgi:hypothetical protein